MNRRRFPPTIPKGVNLVENCEFVAVKNPHGDGYFVGINDGLSTRPIPAPAVIFDDLEDAEISAYYLNKKGLKNEKNN